MSSLGMGLVLCSLLGLFAYSAQRRWALLSIGAPTWESRTDKLVDRLRSVVVFALYQKKMRYYLVAGLAHNLIFVGFSVLTLRTLMLWGRGFDPEFNLFILSLESPLGQIYAFLKDVFAGLVLLGVSAFIYYRVIKPQKRMTLSGEGLLILVIIAVMMITDLMYDGAAQVLNVRYAEFCAAQPGLDLCGSARDLIAPLPAPRETVAYHFWPEPGGSLFSVALAEGSLSSLVFIAQVGFWAHASLVLVLLNILPYSKHFHIITAIPNIFLGDQTPKGRLRPMAPSTEKLLEQVELATEDEEQMQKARIGYSRIEHFTWKDIVDFYTCTECGRCSDNCPASLTGKKLSPKHLTLDLRDELYSYQDQVAAGAHPRPTGNQTQLETRALLPEVVDPDVIWACTTCRACEEQCPVGISYVDKIVQMRRNQVTIFGEFPAQLNKPFEGMETNGNPWNLSRLDRSKWTEGLDIPTAAENPTAPVLYWVGCAASYDDRAKKIARATAQLLKSAQVDFAILGEEETCTGDPARRAGNEYLFSMLAETNIETLEGYRAQGGVQTIITTCPHCFNTIKNEYPDFGQRFEVVHHTDYLLGLLAEGRLKPTIAVPAKVAYHDSCYLGRYNDIYDSPREILQKIEGVQLLEVQGASRHKGLCCGAGGAQMFMEEQNADRVNVKRTKQLLETGADTVASACPFCMTMLTDGLKSESKEDEIAMMDVVELLARACG